MKTLYETVIGVGVIGVWITLIFALGDTATGLVIAVFSPVPALLGWFAYAQLTKGQR
jgi:hypothetical protein